jgi:DNA-binding transcriptional ArsR family regulator
VSLKDRIGVLAVELIDAAATPSGVRTSLSRELLTLSSLLSIARTGGFLSPMNAELITREAHSLLQEVAEYEEPRLLLEEVPTLSGLAKSTVLKEPNRRQKPAKKSVKDISDIDIHLKDRQETILAVIKDKQTASIKDISTLIRGVSEKTIQRELASLIGAGKVKKEGERRWSTYSLAG